MGIFIEGYMINQKGIYYNKEKFDNGEINLCFITGHSGSGKSTMANNMQSKKIESYELDDIQYNFQFSDDNLKEYGDLIYSFFKGPGKKYRLTEELPREKLSKFIQKAIPSFISYAIQYSKAHKNTKCILNGVQFIWFMNPKDAEPYAVYIKGTSALISAYRARKRDGKLWIGLGDRIDFEGKIKIWRKHFESLM